MICHERYPSPLTQASPDSALSPIRILQFAEIRYRFRKFPPNEINREKEERSFTKLPPLFQSRREIGQHGAVLAGAERAAGGGETVMENAVVSQRF